MYYISHNLKYYRTANRLTQSEIGEKINATVGMVKHYESGKAAPQIETLVAISDMMGVSIDALIRVKLNDKNFKQHPSGTMKDILKRLEAIEKLVKK